VHADTARLDAIVRNHAHEEGNLLPILHDVQGTFGCVDEAAKRHLAKALNLTRAEIQGVVSFYTDFRDAPADRPVIKLCQAEACQARGADALAEAAERIAGGRAEVEAVYCLGLCGVGPAAMKDDAVYARLDEAGLATLVRKG